MVRRYQIATVPVAFLYRDLAVEFLEELVARRGRQPAELHRRTVRPDRVDADCLLIGVDAGKAVEIGPPVVIIIGVPHPLDRLTDLVPGELERTGAHYIFLVPTRVFIEDLI